MNILIILLNNVYIVVVLIPPPVELGDAPINIKTITINNEDFEIGKTGILEFDNVQITSLSFKQDELSSTLIDCVLE